MSLEMSQSIGSLAAALAKAQAEVEGAAKDRVNPHFKSAYATLASVWEACRAALSKNGVAVVQSPIAEGAVVTVTTLLAHASGEWLRSSLSAAARDATPQSIGSAVTYLRRYGLASMVGVAPEDDDGEQSVSHVPRQQSRQEQAPSGIGTSPSDPAKVEFEAIHNLLLLAWPSDHPEDKGKRLEWHWKHYKGPRDDDAPPAKWNPLTAYRGASASTRDAIRKDATALAGRHSPPDERVPGSDDEAA